MSPRVGYASLDVIPTFPGITEKLAAGTAGPASAAGTKAGSTFGVKFGEQAKIKGAKGAQGLFSTVEKGALQSGLGIGRRAGAGINKGLKEYAKFAGASVAGYFAAEKVKQIVSDSINQASDLAESANKIQVTFGAAGDEIIKFAQGTDTRLGLSELQARDAAGSFGVFANAAGLSDAAGAKFSERLVGLSSDLASFYNTSPDQAIEAIGAALRGESEPIRAYGILLQDATLRQEALKLGLVDTTKNALTPQQRVLAAYHVILDQTGKAQGDFSRTSSGLANQERILSAEFANLEAAAGKQLLPVLTTLARVGTEDVLPFLSQAGAIAHTIPGPLYEVAGAYVALRLAQTLMTKVPLGTWASSAERSLDGVRLRAMLARDSFAATAEGESLMVRSGRSIKTFTQGLGQARAGVGALGVGLGILSSQSDGIAGDLAGIGSAAALGFSVGGPWGAAIGGGIGLITSFGSAEKTVTTDVEGLTASLDQQTGAVTKHTKALVVDALEQNGLLDVLRENHISLADVTSAAVGNEAAMARLRAQYAYLNPTVHDSAANQQALMIIQQESTRATYDDAAAHGEQSDALHRAFGFIGAEAGAVDDSRRRWDERREALGQSTTATDKQSDAEKKLGDQTSDTAGALDDAARATHQLYDQTLRLDNQALGIRGALSNYQSSLDDVTDSLKKNGPTLDIQTEAGRANRDVLDAVATSALEAETHMTKAARVKFNNEAHDKLVALHLEFNGNRVAAEHYADRVLGKLIPVLATTKQQLDDTTTAAQTLGEQEPTVTVNADTAIARAGIDGFVAAANRSLDGIHDEPVTVTLSAQANKVFDQLGPLGLKGGGAVPGNGGPTSDTVPAMLSPGERVNYAAVVTKAGHGSNARGQAIFDGFERLIMRGELGRLGDLQGFAGGGAVNVVPATAAYGLSSAAAAIQGIFDAVDASVSAALSGAVSKKLTYLPSGGQLGPGGALTPAQLMRGQQFAGAQVGKPYGWGMAGPDSYDCSGYQSATLNAAMGYANPYFRRGSTGTMPWPGSAPGLGKYTMGWTTNWDGSGIGHTAGNIGGLNVESYGGHGPAVGAGARSPLDPHFYGHMHFADGGAVPFRHLDRGGGLDPGLSLVMNGLGRREYPNPHDGASNADVVDAIRSLEETLRTAVLRTNMENADQAFAGVKSTSRASVNRAEQKKSRRRRAGFNVVG